jgi:hypothetical protein
VEQTEIAAFSHLTDKLERDAVNDYDQMALDERQRIGLAKSIYSRFEVSVAVLIKDEALDESGVVVFLPVIDPSIAVGVKDPNCLSRFASRTGE